MGVANRRCRLQKEHVLILAAGLAKLEGLVSHPLGPLGSGLVMPGGRDMANRTIEVKKLTPLIGAEVSGVDVSKPLSEAVFQEIHAALMENLVIFFRDQTLTPEQHKAFGRRFGELHVHPASPG